MFVLPSPISGRTGTAGPAQASMTDPQAVTLIPSTDRYCHDSLYVRDTLVHPLPCSYVSPQGFTLKLKHTADVRQLG